MRAALPPPRHVLLRAQAPNCGVGLFAWICVIAMQTCCLLLAASLTHPRPRPRYRSLAGSRAHSQQHIGGSTSMAAPEEQMAALSVADGAPAAAAEGGKPKKEKKPKADKPKQVLTCPVVGEMRVHAVAAAAPARAHAVRWAGSPGVATCNPA